MPSWRFTGGNPLIITPTLLNQLEQYQALADSPSVSSEQLNQQLEYIRQTVSVKARPDQGSAFGAAGNRLEQPLMNRLYGDMNDYTHVVNKAMPPIRLGKGIYMGGFPDVVHWGANGPQAVDDIKTTFIGAAGKEALINKLSQYANSAQNAYATAFGLPGVNYRGFAYANPNDPASAYKYAESMFGAAPSVNDLSVRVRRGLETLDQLGYMPALERSSRRSWMNLVTKPLQEWGERGVVSPSILAHPEERDILTGFELKSLMKLQKQELALEKGSISGAALRRALGEKGVNTGMSLESALIGGGIKVKTIRSAAGSSGRGAGEDIDPPFSPKLTIWGNYSKAMMSGDVESAAQWKGLYSDLENKKWPKGAWSDVFELGAQESFKEKQESAVFSRLKAGDEEGASYLRAADSVNSLNEAILKLADSSRKAAEAERKRDSALGALGSAQPYDWTRWYKARGEAWGGFQQATSWLPNFVTNPMSRFGNAGMQVYGAEVARLKGPYDAVMQGAMPLAAAIGGGFFGPPGIMVGGAIGGGISAISQIIGNIGEGKIKAGGLDLNSKMNMWGGAASIATTVIGTGFKALLLPLDLFAKALKVAVPSILGFGAALARTMGTGMRLMGSLGNPLSSMTQSSYSDYQGSQYMDIMSGMSSGSTSASVQRMAIMREGLKMGRYDVGHMLDAAMLGEFNMFYGGGGNGYDDYNSRVTKLARKMYGQSGDARARSMYRLQDIDATLATHVETLLQKYQATGSTSMDWATYSSPRTHGIPERRLTEGQRVKFREESFSYQTMKSAIDIDKIRIASRLWNDFGKGVLDWVQRLYELAGSGASFKEIAGYVGGGLKDLWGTVIYPVLKDSIHGFGGFLKKMIDKMVGLGPSLAAAIKPAFMHVAKLGFDIFWELGSRLWDMFRTILYNMSTVQIDGRKIAVALATGGSLKDAISFTPPVDEGIANAKKYIKSENGTTVFYEGGKLRRYVFDGKGGYKDLNDPLAQKIYQGNEALEAIDSWYQQRPAQKSAAERDKLYSVVLAAKGAAIYNKWSPGRALSGLQTYLEENGLARYGKDVYDFIPKAGYDDGRNFMKGIGAGDKASAWKPFNAGLEALFSESNITQALRGLGNVGKSSVEIVLQIVDESGKELLSKAMQVGLDGANLIVNESIDLLEDIGRRSKNLSELTINRAQQRLLGARAAGAMH